MTLRVDQTTQALDTVQKLSLFQGTTPEQQAMVVVAMEFRALVAGKVILLEQEISKTLYLLAQGSVGIWVRRNQEKQRLAVLRAPDFFGEISMFSDKPVTALVKTEEPSHLFLLTRERFDALVARDPALGALMQKNVEAIQKQRLSITKPA